MVGSAGRMAVGIRAPGNLTLWRRLPVLVVVALGSIGLSACHPKEPHVDISGIYPAFQKTVVDYVNRCDPATPTDVHITAPSGTTVSVNGSPPQGGDFTAQVPQQVGERFTLVVTNVDGTRTHHVRCLPTDFPAWSSKKTGTTQAEYYATTLITSDDGDNYSAIFDTNGVPVWWLKPQPGFLFLALPNKNFAVVGSELGFREYDINGDLVQTLTAVGGPTDFHDAILLSNGNYVLGSYQPQPCDLTAWGIAGPQTCYNNVLQELTPTNQVVWQWDASAHIPVTETTPHWRRFQSTIYDPWHYNSVKSTGDGFIISFRHLDAVYKIDKATGTVAWKLGGTARPESLALVDDPLGGTSGQHDARLLADGSVTIYDNGAASGVPRNVRYAIDTDAKTATLVEDVRDTGNTSSPCCGSARRLPGGNWVQGWGGSFLITENLPDGTRVFRLTVGFVYRGNPILPGTFTAAEFRNGMDSQYP